MIEKRSIHCTEWYRRTHRYTYTHTNVHIHTHVCPHMCIHIFSYMCVCIYDWKEEHSFHEMIQMYAQIYMHPHICTYIHTYMSTHVYAYIFIYVYMYTWLKRGAFVPRNETDEKVERYPFAEMIRQFPLNMMDPRHPPNRETQIPRYKFKFNQNLNLNLNRSCTVRYRGMWDFWFGGLRGCCIFSGNCYTL